MSFYIRKKSASFICFVFKLFLWMVGNTRRVGFFSFNLTGIPDFILFLVKLTAASEQHRIFIAVMFHYSLISVFHPPGFCSKMERVL